MFAFYSLRTPLSFVDPQWRGVINGFSLIKSPLWARSSQLEQQLNCLPCYKLLHMIILQYTYSIAHGWISKYTIFSLFTLWSLNCSHNRCHKTTICHQLQGQPIKTVGSMSNMRTIWKHCKHSVENMRTIDGKSVSIVELPFKCIEISPGAPTPPQGACHQW